MASDQVSAPELEEDVKVEEEAHEDDMARENEVENLDLTKPVVEDKQDLFEVEDKVHEEDKENREGITKVPTYGGARVISDDNDELDAEGDGVSDEDTIYHLQ